MPETPRYQRFLAELKRRKVLRVMAVYGVVGFVLLQVVDLAVPALLLPDWTYRLVALLLLVGFPVAAVFAWAFEVGPAGVRRTPDAGPAELAAIAAESAGRRWPSGLLALAGVVLLVAGAWWIGRRTAATGAGPTAVKSASASEVLDVAYRDLATDPRPSIAVLPFADMSPASDQRYFADGMSEELLNALAKIRGLRVAGRTSSFAYRDAEEDLREIGHELGVRYLVEGSVRKQADRLRITAQLVDADDNFHVWSDAYDRTLDDVFAVQEEIAGAIAKQLQVSLGLDSAGSLVAPTKDLEGYDLYLRAKELMRKRGDGVREAVRLFEQLVARDSTWAPGWAGLAQAHSLVPFFSSARPYDADKAEIWRVSLASAEAAARRALDLDPRVAGADVALGNVYRDRWQWARGEEHYLRALEIDPDDVEAHQQYAELLLGMGREGEALRSARRAVALDPTSAIRLNELGNVLIANGRPREAIPQYELALLHAPDVVIFRGNLVRARFQEGDLDGAERELRREYLPRLGLDEETLQARDQQIADRFAALRSRDREAYEKCCASTPRPGNWLIWGDTARAIETMHDVFEGRAKYSVVPLMALWDPDLDPIRGDPRFQKVLAQILDEAGLHGAKLRRAGPDE
jgi:TolB-like protein/Tfp pilus assembly protein PilF